MQTHIYMHIFMQNKEKLQGIGEIIIALLFLEYHCFDSFSAEIRI